MSFPQTRLRRMRSTRSVRRLIQESRLSAGQLVLPIFIRPGRGISSDIPSLPGVRRHTVDQLPKLLNHAVSVGVSAFLFFAESEERDPTGKAGWRPDGLLQDAVRTATSMGLDICVIADMCLCTHTIDGHCGLVRGEEVLNDESLDALNRIAVSLADAGTDLVAPSGMLDGKVAEIRRALDVASHSDVGIMSYAVKFASALYEPFRETMDSGPRRGDRRTYQLSPANGREAAREAEQDASEGADILMIKPALGYLDVVARLREQTALPLAVYNVSGEYAMIKAAAAAGAVDEKMVVTEWTTGFLRAGADIVITYHALDLAGWMQDSELNF